MLNIFLCISYCFTQNKSKEKCKIYNINAKIVSYYFMYYHCYMALSKPKKGTKAHKLNKTRQIHNQKSESESP